MAVSCGGSAPNAILPPVTALTYRAPSAWVPAANPRDLPPEPGLQFVSAYRSPVHPAGAARVALYTLAVPAGLTYPDSEAAQMGVVSGLIDAPSFVRWRRVVPTPLAGVPGLHATADTTAGVTHQYVAFGRRKLFLLELTLPAGWAGEGAALQADLLTGAALK